MCPTREQRWEALERTVVLQPEMHRIQCWGIWAEDCQPHSQSRDIEALPRGMYLGRWKTALVHSRCLPDYPARSVEGGYMAYWDKMYSGNSACHQRRLVEHRIHYTHSASVFPEEPWPTIFAEVTLFPH